MNKFGLVILGAVAGSLLTYEPSRKFIFGKAKSCKDKVAGWFTSDDSEED